MKDQACSFWGLEAEYYSLYDTNYGHLMALNVEEDHPVNKVSGYFEAIKTRYPSLFLLRDQKDKSEADMTQQ